MSRKTPIDLDYLNRGLKEGRLVDANAVLEALEKKVAVFDPKMIFRDIGHFLEDPAEESWIKRYRDVFQQLKTNLHAAQPPPCRPLPILSAKRGRLIIVF